MSEKMGRNDSCSCGSGKKFKKCCLAKFEQKTIPVTKLNPPPKFDLKRVPLSEVPPEVLAEFKKKQEEEALRVQRRGKVKPMISANFQGQTMIAVGNAVHWHDKWKTPTDFLYDYLKIAFGTDWWKAQWELPEDQLPVVCKWAKQMYEYQKVCQIEKDNLYGVIPNGPMLAYLTLAQDLYVLKHHMSLQTEVVRRMKDRNNFHGARYELFVAATFIRAGFDIKYENENDGSKKHPEFIAAHQQSGIEFDVEAKKRNRLKKFTLADFDAGKCKIDARDLLGSAVGKFRDRPYIVFLDLDVPPIQGDIREKPWFEELANLPIDAGVQDHEDKKDCMNMICYTNFPTDYADESYPVFSHFEVISENPKVPLPNEDCLHEIRRSVPLFQNFPEKINEQG